MTHLPYIAAFIALVGLIVGAQCNHPWWGLLAGIGVVVVMVEVHWRHK